NQPATFLSANLIVAAVKATSQSLQLERQAEGRSLKFPDSQDQFLSNNDQFLSASLKNEDTATTLKSSTTSINA
ncbi:Hypothetical predicted protein, partial [Paramuricea clavata]